ncbi:helix-turn-helix domain-containing protein [Paenibacillus sp. YYML68]|uniref:helix-turn-helix domain-containing protein n=1 Tax=Paenibacillus sp. YYML68 TaxID=2909250 RepID=UPI002491B654|nr:helix-turn-helix domain-containing protein [Paenibacillus sp. YYML68]
MRRTRKQSVILTWFFSYLIVLLLPIVVSLFVYQQFSKSLTHETQKAYSSLLMQLQEVVDNQLESMKRLSYQITWDHNVQNMLSYNHQDVAQKSFSYDSFLVAQQLARYKSSYFEIDQFYIYLTAPQMVIFPGVVNESRMAYQFEHQNEAFSYEEWTSLMNQGPLQGFTAVQRSNGEAAIAYLQSFLGSKAGRSIGMSVVMIDQSRFVQAIRKVQLLNEGNVFIVNNHHEILLSSDSTSNTFLDNLKLEQLSADSGYVSLEVEGQSYEVFYTKSALTKSTYITMVPSRLLWEKAEKVRNLTYASFVISLVVGIILALLLLRRNYGPIRRLLQKVTENAVHPSSQRVGNEFAFIEQSLNQTYRTMDDMLVHMKQSRHVLRSHAVTRLLKGKPDSKVQVEDAMTTYDISFRSDDFAVMLFLIEETEEFYNKIDWMQPYEQQQMLQFIVSNVVEELVRQKHTGYVVESEDMLACLVNFSQSSEDRRMEELMRIAQEAQTFLHRSYQIHMTISISSIHRSLSGIHQAYLNALDAMDYKLVMGRREIITYDQIRSEPHMEQHKTYHYPLSVEQKLINAVKTGNSELAVSTLNDIIDQNCSNPLLSLPLVKCLMFDLASTLVKTINEMDDEEQSSLSATSTIEQMMNSATIQEMKEQLIDTVNTICRATFSRREGQIADNRQRAVQGLVMEVVTYIERNYSNINLNVSMIGEVVEMSPTYVSKLFKQRTGEGILEYINKYRIQQAKRLIEEQQLGIKEVGMQVGYSEATTFIRAFKKYEGVTPGKYRDSLGRSCDRRSEDDL